MFKIPYLGRPMRQITYRHLKICLEKAKEMFDKYQTWGDGDPGFERNVDVLGSVCARDLEESIRVYDVEAVPEELKELCGGLCLVIEDGSYEINLHPALNPCWQRFILCKELFQVVLDGQEYRSVNLYAHLEQLIQIMPGDGDDDSIYLPGVSELMAEIAAMEFLFPYSERLKIKSQKSINLLDVATKYRIPQKFVAIYLSDAYMGFLNPDSDDLKVAESSV